MRSGRKPIFAVNSFTHFTSAEMVERRRLGLCFNCPEKFSQEHLKVCPMNSIYMLEFDDSATEEPDSP